MNIVIISTIILSTIGLLIGIFLVIFSNIFKVEVNETVLKIRECLPGNNCGGCGYSGCDALANAIFEKKASTNACPVGGKNCAEKISKVLGVSAGETIKKVAFVHCNGNCDNVEKIYNYHGIKSCLALSRMPNKTDKECRFSCIGLGDCVKVCQFNAISIIKNVAVINKEKCTSCSQCIKICPKNIIELVPYDSVAKINCNNKDNAKIANKICKVSCIGCKVCEKNCPKKAIEVIDNLSYINYDLCDNCEICKQKCPRKCIN